MSWTRRAWMGGVAALASGLACRRREAAAATRLGTIIGGGAYGVSDQPTARRYALTLADLDRGTVEELEVTFTVHGFAPDPTRARRAVCFEKQGPGGCEVDLRALGVTRAVPPTAGRVFYGHGVFSRDGALLFAVETDPRDRRGVVVVRDGRSLAVVGEFPSYGDAPHDCQVIDGGATLVMTNGGGPAAPPSVVFVDVRTAELRERLPIAEARWNAGHVAVTEAGDVVCVSAPRDGLGRDELGGVSVGARGGGLRALTEPAPVVGALRGESLSVAIDPAQGLIGVTTPSAGRLTFWDLATGALRRELRLPLARGLCRTLDGSAFVVSHAGGQLDRIDPARLELDPATTVTGTKLSGSHLYAWDPRA